MKAYKKIFLAIVAGLTLTACDLSTLFDGGVIEKMEVSPNDITIDVGIEFDLNVKILSPEFVTDRTVYWTSSDQDIVTVDQNGKIRGINRGEATVSAVAKYGGAHADCSVHVEEVIGLLTSIAVQDQKTNYEIGDEFVKPTVIATYQTDLDGSTDTKDVTSKAKFSGFDSSTSGTKTITVSYTENTITKTTTYDVQVAEQGGSGISKKTLKYDYTDVTGNNFARIDSCPSVGTAKLLVIPVWFTDSSTCISTSKKANVRSDIQTAYFGSASDTGWQSVKSFYETESHGQLALTGTVTDWYECGKSSSYFYSDNGMKTGQFAELAANWYFQNNPSDSRKNYDCDGDGYLDGVMCIYGYPNFRSKSGSGSNLWAYAFWLQDSSKNSKTSPGLNSFFWASYDFMYGSNASSRTGYSYHYGDTSHCSVDAHTYIHEMGHVFGLDDYYDYNDVAEPAGKITMQDENVCGHDPYSVMALGWASPYIPTETMDITINSFQESGDLILLTPSWNKYDSPFDEYILLELYSPTGLNQFDATYQYAGRDLAPNAAGIRVWHVDSRLITYKNSSYPFTTYPLENNGVELAMSNTYWSNDEDNNNIYTSRLAQEVSSTYGNYNLLQYIRKDSYANYKPNSVISSSNMFKQGDTFKMNTYKNQFYTSGRLNNGLELGWEFKVKSLNSSKATITVTKVA